MKKWLTGLVAACAVAGMVGAAEQERTLRVLMVGNSFSEPVWKNMPQVAEAMGCRLDIASVMIGGSELKKHWNKYIEAQTNATYRPYNYHRNEFGKVHRGTKCNLLEAVTNAAWDVITVQQASHASMHEKTYAPYGDDLVAALRKVAPQAKIYVQQTWFYLPFGAKTLEEGIANQRSTHERIVRAYANFAARVAADGVIPTGTAVQLFRERLPVVYRENDAGGDVVGNNVAFERDEAGRWKTAKGSDCCHLGPEGEYLQALVWTAKLFGVDVTKCPYVAPCVADPKRAELMKACAMAAVAGGTKARDSVVIVPAHPDDLSAAVGFCLLAHEKYDIHVIDFTHGERGCGYEKFTNGWTKATRTREEESVCAAVGAKLHWLDEVDGEAYACRETCRRLAGLLKAIGPRAIIAHWPVDIHTDHVMAGAAVLRAALLSGLRPEIYFFEQPYQGKRFAPDITLDITPVAKRKLEVIRLWKCQNGNDGLVRHYGMADEFRGLNSANFYGGRAEAFVSYFPLMQGARTIFSELPGPDPAALPSMEGALEPVVPVD